jgi:pimeloyl-ACP methyl ester carboxylesterase
LILVLAGLVGLPLLINGLLYGHRRLTRGAVDCGGALATPAAMAARAWVAECFALAHTAALAIVPLYSAGSEASGKGLGHVVLVTDAALPRRALRSLCHRLGAAGWSAHIAPVRFRPATAESDSEDLRHYVYSLPHRDTPLIVVGHGSGGLLARLLAARHPDSVDRIITLATPHQGTEAPLTPAGLRPGAPLFGLLEALDAAPPRVDAIAIYSGFDVRLQPTSNGYLPGGFNIEVRAIGYLSGLYSPRMFDLLLENINAAVGSSARAPDSPPTT